MRQATSQPFTNVRHHDPEVLKPITCNLWEKLGCFMKDMIYRYTCLERLGTPKFHLSTLHSCFLNEKCHMSSHILPRYQPFHIFSDPATNVPSHSKPSKPKLGSTQPYPAIFGGTNDGRRLPTILDHGRIGYPFSSTESTL